MRNGFEREHFELLSKWNGQSRVSSDPKQDHAYKELKRAYAATDSWARALQVRQFPNGYVKSRQRPTNQANNFKPYTWAKIYPRPEAPEVLAYTVGIDATWKFCVKIDTVNGTGQVQARFEQLCGEDDHKSSPFAGTMTAEEGLAMSPDQLVEWSIKQIKAFAISYEEVAHQIGLVGPLLELVTDPVASRNGFAEWEGHLQNGAVKEGPVWWQSDGGIFYDRHKRGNDDDGGIELGLDPLGKRWAVQINKPPVAGDYNRLSSIAIDEIGTRFLLRQGILKHDSQRSTDIKDEEFSRLTGLQPVSVKAHGLSAKRRWFIVAVLDEPPDIIRRKTAIFVERCWAARLGEIGKEGSRFSSPFDDQLGGEETGGTYIIRSKPAAEEKTVVQQHGIVWRSLAALLSTNEIGYRKWQRADGFEIDMVIDRGENRPLLIELKTDISTSNLYTGLGQLHLYRSLFPRLKDHYPVLLVPNGLRDKLKMAIEDCGVVVHTYRFLANGDDKTVMFSPEFLTVCGILPNGISGFSSPYLDPTFSPASVPPLAGRIS